MNELDNSSLCYSNSFINIFKKRLHSIGIRTLDFLVTPPPLLTKPIFRQMVKFSVVPNNITSFGHIKMPGSSFIYPNYFSKVKGEWDLMELILYIVV